MRESLRRLTSDDKMTMIDGKRKHGIGFVRVELLDGTYIDVDIDRKAKAGELLDRVCDHLELVEKDYFGLTRETKYDSRFWIDLDKKLDNLFKSEPWEVKLAVRFYPREVELLYSETTRYQICLAIRNEIFHRRLMCSDVTYTLLASYALQSELGDYDDTINIDFNEYRLVPNDVLTSEIEEKIIELYKNHKGQLPSESDIHYLENSFKLQQYGVFLHSAKDSDDSDICIGVSANGINVYRDSILLNQFRWPKILKISYNKRTFSLRLRPSEFEEYQSTITFKLDSSKDAKTLWKTSVEHHIFFRRVNPVNVARVPSLPRLGSRLRYSRRTLNQIRHQNPADSVETHNIVRKSTRKNESFA